MDKDEIVYAINRVIRGELDDCENAIQNDDKEQALSDLEDAVIKLKRIIRAIE
jgi:hypothetical protein